MITVEEANCLFNGKLRPTYRAIAKIMVEDSFWRRRREFVFFYVTKRVKSVNSVGIYEDPVVA